MARMTTSIGASDAPTPPRAAAGEDRRALKTKKEQKKKTVEEEEAEALKALLDDDEFAAGKLAVFPPAQLVAKDDEEDEYGEGFVVSPIQCEPSNLATDDGIDRCVDACEPGLCCLADEGREASFALPGEAGRGRVTLTGCRSPSNEGWCIRYLPCSRAFAGLATTRPNGGGGEDAGTLKAKASKAVAAAASVATELHRSYPREAYAVGAFAALVLLATLAAIRRRLRGGEGGRVRRDSLGKYEKVKLLEANEDEEDDGTGSLCGASRETQEEPFENPDDILKRWETVSDFWRGDDGHGTTVVLPAAAAPERRQEKALVTFV